MVVVAGSAPDADYTKFGGLDYPSFETARTVSNAAPPIQAMLDTSEFVAERPAATGPGERDDKPSGYGSRSAPNHQEHHRLRQEGIGYGGTPGVLPSFL